MRAAFITGEGGGGGGGVLSHEVPTDGRQRAKETDKRERERKVAEEAARAKLRIGHNNFPRNLFERHNIIFYTRKVVGKGREGVGRGGGLYTQRRMRSKVGAWIRFR